MSARFGVLLLIAAGSAAAAPSEEVAFPSGSLQLHGFIRAPEGKGPFPAILYNHGSEPRPGPKPRRTWWRPTAARRPISSRL